MTGLSFEFLAYNITGFVFYSLYSTIKYFVSNGCGQTVQINDLAFGYHAVALTLLTILQCIWYRTKSQAVHPIHGFIVATLWIITLYTLILCFVVNIPLIPSCHTEMNTEGQPVIVVDTTFTLIDLMGYIKAGISIIKYTPQVYLNWSRQSTVGWSIMNILLDFIGGSLSFAQQGLDAYNAGTMSPITGNIPKLLLAIESMIFDIIFIIQHYVLYRGLKPITQGEDGEEEGDEGGRREDEQGEGDDQIEGKKSSSSSVSSAAAVKKKSNNRDGEEDFYYQLPPQREASVFDEDGLLEPGSSLIEPPAYYAQQPRQSSGSSASSASLLPALPRYTIQSNTTQQQQQQNNSLLYRPPSSISNQQRGDNPYVGQWSAAPSAIERR